GSNTSIYNDFSRPLSERGTQLINDVLQAILAALYPVAVAALDTMPHPDEITVRLDDFQSAISSVKIKGVVEREISSSSESSAKADRAASAEISKAPSVKLSLGLDRQAKSSETSRAKSSGEALLHVDFGNVQTALSGLIEVLGTKRLWLLIDE